MKELKFKKIDRRAEARHDREVRGLVEQVKASTPKTDRGITARSLLKYLFEFNRKANDGLAMLDGLLAGEIGDGKTLPPDQQAALLTMRPIFAAVASVCPYKPKKNDDV